MMLTESALDIFKYSDIQFVNTTAMFASILLGAFHMYIDHLRGSPTYHIIIYYTYIMLYHNMIYSYHIAILMAFSPKYA